MRRTKTVIRKAKRSLRAYCERARHGGHQPDLFILGAQKSGTTTLFNALNLLPQFAGAQVKELHFFDVDDRFRKGVHWYENHFVSRSAQVEHFFEASPDYLCRPWVARRIHNYNPHAKHIIILRDPAARAYSAWNMFRNWSSKRDLPNNARRAYKSLKSKPLYTRFLANRDLGFSEYIKYEIDLINSGRAEIGIGPSIVGRGIYQPQIERYVNRFGRENVKIFGFRELTLNPARVVGEVAQFMGTDVDAHLSEVRRINTGSYLMPIRAPDRETLALFYAPWNRQLWDYLGYRPSW